MRVGAPRRAHSQPKARSPRFPKLDKPTRVHLDEPTRAHRPTSRLPCWTRGEYERRFERHGYRVVEAMHSIPYVPFLAVRAAIPAVSVGAARLATAAVTLPLHAARALTEPRDYFNWILARA